MIKCSKCGSENQDSSKFCCNCGEKIGRFCESCGANVQANAKFCPDCGTRISETPNSGAPVSIELSTESKLQNLEVQVKTVIAKGPDSDQDFGFEIAFTVKNNGIDHISLLSVNSEVLNSLGLVVADTRDFYEEELSPGDIGEFETTIWGVKKDLLGNSPELSKVVVSAIAASGEKIEIHKGKVSGGEFEVAPLAPNNLVGNVEMLAGSYWQTKPDDDDDAYLEARVLLQNMTPEFFPQLKLFMDIYDKKGGLLESSDNYQELVAGGVVSVSTSARVQVKELKNASLSLYLQMLRMCGSGFGLSERAALVSVENDDSGDESDSCEGTKRIYVKTEPGGRVMFGRLSSEEEELLKTSLRSKLMAEELSDLRYNSSGGLREYEGVFNQGDAGDFGNEGSIVYDEDGPVEIPRDGNGKYEDGSYYVFLSLSKVSIEFEFTPNDGNFDEDKFEEVSVPIVLPECISHELYGHPDYNVVIDYRYDGESIEEYSREIVDRGYDDQVAFVVVKNGNPKVVYTNYNGNEKWEC